MLTIERHVEKNYCTFQQEESHAEKKNLMQTECPTWECTMCIAVYYGINTTKVLPLAIKGIIMSLMLKLGRLELIFTNFKVQYVGVCKKKH